MGGWSSAQVRELVKISSTETSTLSLDDIDQFGYAVTSVGDVDSNGHDDLVIGSPRDDDGGKDTGAIWLVLMGANGVPLDTIHISDTVGGFAGVIDNSDYFGCAVCGLGDFDGDSYPDVAIGACGDDDYREDAGAIYIVSLDGTGAVGEKKISRQSGDFSGWLDEGDGFGSSVTGIGDLDGDGVLDLAVGATGDDDGAWEAGAVWILFLNVDGTVKSHVKLSGASPIFDGLLDAGDAFGRSLAALGDLNNDSVPDIAVGVIRDDTGGSDRGSVYVLFMETTGEVQSFQKICSGESGFTGQLDNGDLFGMSIATIGDMDEDGIVDIAVGAPGDDDLGPSSGAFWMVFLRTTGNVKETRKVPAAVSPLDGLIDPVDNFGASLGTLPDFDGDGRTDLVAGAIGDDDGGLDQGAAYVLRMGYGAFGSARQRNGSGVNRSCYSSQELPGVGTPWSAMVVMGPHSGTKSVFIFGYDTPLDGLMTPYGELLISPEGLGGTWYFTDIETTAGTFTFHTMPIPNDPALGGLSVATQAMIYSSWIELGNAIDLVIGGWQ